MSKFVSDFAPTYSTGGFAEAGQAEKNQHG
jgi:hypothetical protein